MAWVKLTDDFDEHPKLLAAGPLASWLWVASIAWSNRRGTDGKIPAAMIPRLVNFEGVGVYTGTYSGQDVDVRDLSDVLVNVGLWEEVGDGYAIHDYADYQLTTDQLAERRDKKAAAGRAGGQASATARARAGATAEVKPVSRIPVPNDSLSSSNEFNRDIPNDLWMKVAEEKLKLQRVGTVSNPEAWLASTARNAEQQHAAKAAALIEEFDVSVSQLACALATGKVSPTWNSYRRSAS